MVLLMVCLHAVDITVSLLLSVILFVFLCGFQWFMSEEELQHFSNPHGLAAHSPGSPTSGQQEDR